MPTIRLKRPSVVVSTNPSESGSFLDFPTKDFLFISATNTGTVSITLSDCLLQIDNLLLPIAEVDKHVMPHPVCLSPNQTRTIRVSRMAVANSLPELLPKNAKVYWMFWIGEREVRVFSGKKVWELSPDFV